MFEKVLVCLDGSALAEAILPYITQESRRFQKLIFLSVVHSPVVTLPVGVPGEAAGPVRTDAMLKTFKQALEDTPYYLEEKAKPLREKGLEVECAVVQGAPGPAIIDYARENGVGLIALATHGHSGLRQVALGSTAEFVLRNAGLPVLIVTPGKGTKGK